MQEIRREFPRGNYPLKIEESSFSLSDYQQFIEDNATDIEQFRGKRHAAFLEELAQWHATGQFNFEAEEQQQQEDEVSWPEDSTVVDSPVSGSVWQTEVAVGDHVRAGQSLVILESMKMEIPIQAPRDGVVSHLLLSAGQRVRPGQALVVMEEMV